MAGKRERHPQINNAPSGDRITEWRRHYFKERITRAELAKRSGIGYATLTRWENNGTHNADPYRLERLVETMRVMESERSGAHPRRRS